MYRCETCEKEYEKKQSLAAHVSNCHTYKKRKRISVVKRCKVCNKEFDVGRVIISGKDFKRKKERECCSKKCSHQRTFDRSNKNAKELEKNKTLKPKQKKYKCVCSVCGKKSNSRRRGNMCLDCLIKDPSYHNKMRENGKKGGSNSVLVQQRRSKNEIYFFYLCKEIFTDAKNNEPLFNGWDADIILPSFKVAILWNGKWHYEKIRKNHSVRQVQNRDNIKIKEIIKCGYLPYIIKDMGKANKKFVMTQFNFFLSFLKEKILKDIVFLLFRVRSADEPW